jgi:glycosyltransferase involved in cell wall biosynthesis
MSRSSGEEGAEQAAPTVVCWLIPLGAGDDALEALAHGLPADAVLAAGAREHDVTQSSDIAASPPGIAAAQSPGIAAAQSPGIADGAAVNVIALPASATLAHLSNQAAERWPGSDLVLLFPGTTLSPSSLERLRGAVADESTAATASALSIDTLSVYGELEANGRAEVNADMAQSVVDDSTAAAVAEASVRLRPRLPGSLPSCVHVRRATLDLVGAFDETLGSDHGAVLDLALRARQRGLANLLADDVLVAAPASELPEDDRGTLQARYPALMHALEQPPGPALERSLTLATVAIEPLSVTFDARALGPHFGGTQVYLLELLEALGEIDEVRLRVLVGPDLAGATRERIEALTRTELLSYEQALERPAPSHIVHRPQQVFAADDLLLLRPLGRRLVITHHDLIAYHNPTYFPSGELWQRYVRTTRQALAAADQILFFSRHALQDALREDLADPSRSTVVHLGVDADHDTTGALARSAVPPAGAASLQDAPFLLCIGADYQHKNRPFALSLFAELRARHGWTGALVLAGSHVEFGSSRQQEREVREQRSIPSELVIELPAVSEQERSWLMRNAAAIVYPTVQEGFGLVPFEAALFGIPCLFAAQSSLIELLDADLATLLPWDPVASAAQAAPLLSLGSERDSHVEGLREASRRLRWSDCASATVQAYRQALCAPLRESAEGAWQALEREHQIVLLDRDVEYHKAKLLQLIEEIGPDGLALVGPDALLSREDEHALLAIAARPWLRRPLLGGIRQGFRALHAMRGSDSKKADGPPRIGKAG